ncbi:uncharacterized protein [Antedon mediterranea]|uniref:uncharacterized protein isoform X3 n=1 Tax=Antedon mediterranea TaxID=105859 RepID=UPI003AF937ED
MGLKEFFSKICACNGIQIPNIAQFDAIDICQHLIQLNMQDSKNEDSDTALILGASFGNVSICQSLIDAGANVTLQDKNGGSPLHYAAAHSHRSVCDILIKAGADVNLPNNGHSPLTGAALYGNFDICKALVRAGANVNHQTDKGNTALHSCARSDLTYDAHRNTMLFLMKECADKSVHVQNKSDQSVVDLYNKNMCKKYDNDLRSAQKEKLLQLLKSTSLPDTDITSSDLDIPYAITARGKRVEKAYIEALKEGTIEVNLGMLKVIGQEGVGKTCLINACLGKKFNNNHDITDGIAVIKTVRTKPEEQKWAEDLTEDCGNPNSLYRKLAEENISKIIEVDEESVVEEDGAAAESKHYVSMENQEFSNARKRKKEESNIVGGMIRKKVKTATKNDTVTTEQPGKPGTSTRTEDVTKMSIAEGTETASLEQEWDKDII